LVAMRSLVAIRRIADIDQAGGAAGLSAAHLIEAGV
jgi:hypothetical protein